MIERLIVAWKEKLADRRNYRRLIAEIETLNARELQELRADPGELRRQAWISVYGREKA